MESFKSGHISSKTRTISFNKKSFVEFVEENSFYFKNKTGTGTCVVFEAWHTSNHIP